MATAAVKNTDKNAPKKEAEKASETEESSTTVYKGSDEFERMLVEKATELIGEYAATTTKLAAADGDRDRALKTFIESSDHPEAVQIREQIKAATESLRKLAEKEVVSVTLSDEEKDKLKTLLSAQKDMAKTAIDTLKGTAAMMSGDPAALNSAIEILESRMPASTRGRKPGDAGSSLPRARVNLTVTGGNFTADEPAKFDSFSKAALAFNCDAVDMQKAYAKAAGVDHMDIKSVKHTVNFEFQPNGNGAVYKFVVEPKKTGTPGPKPKSEDESKTEETPAA